MLFNLTIIEKGGATEKFTNVSVAPATPRYLPKVLEQSSTLARVQKDGAGEYMVSSIRPLETSAMIGSPPELKPDPVEAVGGDDGIDLTDAQFFGTGMEGAKTGLFALEKQILLCIPSYSSPLCDY
jgi:hypothetical protein